MNLVDNGTTAVPLTVLTGFLGAGKTTLLNRILTGDHGLRVGVLVNDFGSINIDADLIVGVDPEMISLSNGCVCCEIRDDLVDSVSTLLARPEQVNYIVLEASGVADPAGIFLTFSDETVRDRIRLDSVTCVVDADQIFAHPEYPPLLDLKLRQVGFADMVILNKVSLAGTHAVEVVRSWLDQHFNRLRVVETNYCDVPSEVLMGVGTFDPLRDRFSHGFASDSGNGDLLSGLCRHDHHPDEMFSTSSYVTDRPISLEALRETLRKLPGEIYRVKGIVYAAEVPRRRVVVQSVGRRVDISPGEEWGRTTPTTRLVMIGAADGVDVQRMHELVADCVSIEIGAVQ